MAETYQSRITCDVCGHTSRLGSRLLQVVTIDYCLGCDFRVVAMSTSVEETFVVWILAGIEDVVALCAGSEGCHCLLENTAEKLLHIKLKIEP